MLLFYFKSGGDHISIHALREESDCNALNVLYIKVSFQSTLSVRRATICCRCICSDSKISIHALREESDKNAKQGDVASIKISIHALREESDLLFYFKSGGDHISIHALREESDRSWFNKIFFLWSISIHALREESDRKNHYLV